MISGAVIASMGLKESHDAVAQSNSGAGEASDVGRKVNADGTVREFIANTFIGPLGQQGEDFAMFDALLDVYREFARHSFHKKIALLPPSSYHITVFGGLNEVDRGTERWSSRDPVDAPLEQVTERYLRELRVLPRLDREPFLFEVDISRSPSLRGNLSVPLRPINEKTRIRLQTIRNQLAELTGIRRPDHDKYAYHITLGYFFRSLDPDEVQALATAANLWIRRLAVHRRPFRINSIQLCRLRDMYAFEQIFEL